MDKLTSAQRRLLIVLRDNDTCAWIGYLQDGTTHASIDGDPKAHYWLQVRTIMSLVNLGYLSETCREDMPVDEYRITELGLERLG